MFTLYGGTCQPCTRLLMLIASASSIPSISRASSGYCLPILLHKEIQHSAVESLELCSFAMKLHQSLPSNISAPVKQPLVLSLAQ